MPLNFTIMNKLQFHEGGQPIQLDDLQLLQDNMMEVFKIIMKFLSGNTQVFLVRFPETGSKKEDNGTNTLMVKAGAMVIGGELVQWPDTPIVGTAGDSIYACVKKTNADEREFADGQHRYCREIKAVVFSYSKEGAEEAYDIGELPVLSDLLGKEITKGEWIYAPFYGNNGYEGYFRYRLLNKKRYIQININSQNREWSTDQAYLYGKAKAVFEVNIPWDVLLAKSSYEVRHKRQVIGTYHQQPNGVGAFLPNDDNLRPVDCPINLEIVL